MSDLFSELLIETPPRTRWTLCWIPSQPYVFSIYWRLRDNKFNAVLTHNMTIICYKIHRSLQEPSRGSGDSLCRRGKDSQKGALDEGLGSQAEAAEQERREASAHPGSGGHRVCRKVRPGAGVAGVRSGSGRRWPSGQILLLPVSLFAYDLHTVEFTCLKHTRRWFSVRL